MSSIERGPIKHLSPDEPGSFTPEGDTYLVRANIESILQAQSGVNSLGESITEEAATRRACHHARNIRVLLDRSGQAIDLSLVEEANNLLSSLIPPEKTAP